MAARPPSKAALKRAALAAWWRRYYWPAIILAVDPGSRAGAAVLRSNKWDLDPLVITGVDTNTRQIETLITIAIDAAVTESLPLYMAIESWGAGGPLGIEQWIGLGAARGAWVRAYKLAIAEHDVIRVGSIKLLGADRIVGINQRTWRARTIEESGTRDDDGKWKAYDTDEWKVQARTAAASYFPGYGSIDDPDAAEAACIGYYAARSDELGKKLLTTHLSRHGMRFPPLDRVHGRPKTRKRKR